jgi:hypothetical protein
MGDPNIYCHVIWHVNPCIIDKYLASISTSTTVSLIEELFRIVNSSGNGKFWNFPRTEEGIIRSFKETEFCQRSTNAKVGIQ